MRGRAPTMSTRAARATADLDQPIPEVDAELGRELADAGSDRHARFLTALRRMVHGSHHAATEEPVAAALEEPVPEEALGECLPGLSVADGRRSGGPRGRRRRPPSRLRRSVRLGLGAVLLGACVAVPWLVPAVPAYLADLVPGHRSVVKLDDPVVPAPTSAFVGPVGVSPQASPYDGVRLRAAGAPRQVVVPRLHVDSEVVPISGQSGTLLPPPDPQVLGWWKEGRVVGAPYGSAVVTGHTVHTGGGALDHLDKLVVGDSVRVRTDAGWIRYVVRRTRIYSTQELARNAEQVFRLDGAGRLVLITCADWNGSFYESNAVVFAAPVADQPR